ncbi:YncE family protein [Streptomyces kanamyceticus]|uniref:YncE family protein n=1 Tax=Streptomyces kanamyceticus TaxID=1967 RepID=A0A5J6GEJ2_STRKN|nr:YncE family protein [Streptomyces kanamyceticus]QEU93523.1 YncE family protein [Streptomyces kanamyceticus]
MKAPRRAALAAGTAALAAAVLAGCAAGEDRPAASSPEPARASAPLPAGTKTPEGTLLVADFGSDTVTFVDPEKGPVDSVKVGTAPYGLTVGDDGRAWVATAEGVAVVDTEARERVDRIAYETETGPATTGEYRGGGMGIALAPDGEHVYVGVNVPDDKGVLEVIDTDKREVTDTVPVGRRPFDVDVSKDGGEVYATDHDSFDVTVVRAESLKPRRIEVAPYGTEGGLGSWLKPHYTAVRPSDGRLLLPFEGEKLVVLDPRTGEYEVEKMTANTHQHGVTVTDDGTLFAVGTGPIDPDTDEGPSLTVRTEDGKERVIPLEGPHEDVAVSADGRTAYVTGGFTRDGFWNGVSVVDVREGTVHRLAAGERPLGIAIL